MALNIPSSEKRMSKRGEAAQARDMACPRFFFTLLRRLVFADKACSIYTSYERDNFFTIIKISWYRSFPERHKGRKVIFVSGLSGFVEYIFQHEALSKITDWFNPD